MFQNESHFDKQINRKESKTEKLIVIKMIFLNTDNEVREILQ